MPELVIRRGLEEPDTSGTFRPHKPERPEKALGGKRFELVSDYQPSGDQPTAIRELVDAALEGERTHVADYARLKRALERLGPTERG